MGPSAHGPRGMQKYHIGPDSLSNNSLLRAASRSIPSLPLPGFSILMQAPPVASSRELPTDNKENQTQGSLKGSSAVAVASTPAEARQEPLSRCPEGSSQERATTGLKNALCLKVKAMSWPQRQNMEQRGEAVPRKWVSGNNLF